MNQTTIQLDNTTREQISRLAGIWGLPPTRHITPVISRSVDMAITIEQARRTLDDADFMSFVYALYNPHLTPVHLYQDSPDTLFIYHEYGDFFCEVDPYEKGITTGRRSFEDDAESLVYNTDWGKGNRHFGKPNGLLIASWRAGSLYVYTEQGQSINADFFDYELLDNELVAIGDGLVAIGEAGLEYLRG